ncbi:ArsR family transcriptional regulator [Fontibacillus phaseoli]|uniref:ArsR family transcriptional regulator n=1 Tax=Fontibacillus phaseoli TaxID=1416533 RepID=A0A369B852_9BACL|nr:metalloregulator ArsR/SmtB family transcription factor [Fontibacillus phaseoli]RCX16726.1 ArsR family transcriptional regulator [Fontibacillus phaseoli]
MTSTASAPNQDVFQAVADPTRRQLLGLLGDRELPLKDLTGHFPMSRTAVSKHLRILSDAGLVRERKVGRETRYRLDADPLLELKRWLAYFDRFWENKLSLLKHYVESSPDAGTPAAAEERLRLAGPAQQPASPQQPTSPQGHED